MTRFENAPKATSTGGRPDVNLNCELSCARQGPELPFISLNGQQLGLKDFVYSTLLPHSLKISDTVRDAAVGNWTRLLTGTETYSVRYEDSWKFPDGLVCRGPFLVFNSAGVDYGIVMIKHGTFNDTSRGVEAQPIHIISYVQGVQGSNSQALPVGTSARPQMLRHVISSIQPLLTTEYPWEIGLSASPKNERIFRICFRDEIRDPNLVYAPHAYLPETFVNKYRPIASAQEESEVRRLLRVGERRLQSAHAKV